MAAARPRGTLAFCLLAIALASCSSPVELAEHHISGDALGTTYNIKLASRTATGDEVKAASGIVTRELEAVNESMSTYLESSELSRLNRFDSTDPFPLSGELVHVLFTARQIGTATDGAFDITVGPLVNAWGFGPEGRPEKSPDDEKLQELESITGWDKLEIDEVNSAATKAAAGVYCDLSGIAKGYAVDRVAEALLEAGHVNQMVEVGGEVRAHGVNRFGKPWSIGIERPVVHGRAVQRAIPLRDKSMATSGDYRNYYEVDGRRYSHIIDPRTGAPISHRLASVSVVGEFCTQADGFATALLVLGENRGYEVAIENDLAALFLVRELNGSFTERATPGFEASFGAAAGGTGEE